MNRTVELVRIIIGAVLIALVIGRASVNYATMSAVDWSTLALEVAVATIIGTIGYRRLIKANQLLD